jgi:hypothetical protein
MMNRQPVEIEERLSAFSPYGPAPATLRCDVTSVVQKSLKQQMRWDDFKLISKSLGLLFIVAIGVLTLFSFQAERIKSLVSSIRPIPGLLEFREGYRDLTGDAPPKFVEEKFLFHARTRNRTGYPSPKSLDPFLLE